MHELIVRSFEDYHTIARAVGLNTAWRKRCRERLTSARLTEPLFDTQVRSGYDNVGRAPCFNVASRAG